MADAVVNKRMPPWLADESCAGPYRDSRAMSAAEIQLIDAWAQAGAPEGNPADGSLQILLQTFAIMGKSINSFELRDADVVLRPALGGVKSADFSARLKSIAAGRLAMQQALPQLRQLLAAQSL